MGRRWVLREGKPLEIPWEDVARVGIETVLDLDADDTVALAWEHWLREKVVSRLPSLKPRKKQKQDEEKVESFPPRPPANSDREGARRHQRGHAQGDRGHDENGAEPAPAQVAQAKRAVQGQHARIASLGLGPARPCQ